MEEYVQLKNHGIEKMNKEQFDKAKQDFTEVINRIPTDTDEQIVLKCICHLNLSMCNMFTKQIDEALNDANAVINIYKEKRPETEAEVVQNADKAKDPLIPVLALSYLRRGQVFELQAKPLDALHEYSISCSLKMDDETQKAMKHVLQTVGIPEIEQTDADLRPFGILLLHFLNELELLACLNQLMTYLTETELSQELIKKFNESGASRILVGAVQLYIEREPIVVGCITSMRLCAEKGIFDCFNGFPVIRVVMEHWKQNKNIIGDILLFLRLAPSQLYRYMMNADFIPPVCAALELELSEDEFDAIFFILFSLSYSEPQYTQIVSEGILDQIFERKTDAAFMLLSKLLSLSDVVERAMKENFLDWAITFVQNEEPIYITSGLLAIALSLSQPKTKLTESQLLLIYPIISKAVMSNTKDNEIVSNGFAALAMCAPHATKQITEMRTIRAASAILAMHPTEEIVSQNIITFIYNCAEGGLLDEVKETRAVLPTVMTVLKTYPRSRSIVERSIGLAVLCDHRNKVELLKAGLLEFPNSEILKKYLPVLGIEMPKPEQK